MAKYKKIVVILINMVLLQILLLNPVFGTLIEELDNSIVADGADHVKTVGGKIVGAIQVVGTMIAVAMLTILGIKYALGSAEEKAEYKKTMVPYLIGSVLIFAVSNITQIIYEWASKL